MIDDAKQAALNLFPEDWLESNLKEGVFRIDNNAGKRAVAEDLFLHVFNLLDDKKTVEGVLAAFYRRSMGCEVPESDKSLLVAQMGTAMLYARLQIRGESK